MKHLGQSILFDLLSKNALASEFNWWVAPNHIILLETQVCSNYNTPKCIHTLERFSDTVPNKNFDNIATIIIAAESIVIAPCYVYNYTIIHHSPLKQC